MSKKLLIAKKKVKLNVYSQRGRERLIHNANLQDCGSRNAGDGQGFTTLGSHDLIRGGVTPSLGSKPIPIVGSAGSVGDMQS